MYSFLVRKTSQAQPLYTPYMENNQIYTTNDLTQLAAKYKEVIAIYPTEQVKVIQELDPNISITIVDTPTA